MIEKRKKVRVSERTIKSVVPMTAVQCIDGRVTDAETERAVARADIVFGCLDRDVHRLELVELSARYAKPYLDLATDTAGAGEDLVYSGRVVFSDGTRCLVCLPAVLDQGAIARDRLSPTQREADRRIYGVDRAALADTGPAVVSINGVVASLAVTEFMAFATALRRPVAQLTYDGARGVVRTSLDEPAPDCYYCRRVWGSALAAEANGEWTTA